MSNGRHSLVTDCTENSINKLSTTIDAIRVTGRKKNRAAQKFVSATIYFSILVFISSVASMAYRSPVDISSGENKALASVQSMAGIEKPSVDQLTVISLAAQTADIAGLTVATEVSSQWITMTAKNELAQSDENVISKPQIFEASQARGIKSYRTVAGDNVSSIAARFGISADTLRWANNLTSDAVNPDVELVVPSIDGVVYTAKEGDTIDSLAQRYTSDSARIISQNDLELSGLAVGMKVIIPSGVLPENERPGYTAPRTYSRSSASSTQYYNSNYSVQSGNRYSYGYCTWYSYNRRAELGRPIGSLWGHAATWAYAASAAGYLVDHNPEVGAVMQSGGGYGHVAVVERLNEDGSIVISEMNYAGWNIVSSRTLSAGEAAGYNFIH